LLILAASALIIREAIVKLLHHGEISQIGMGFIAMFVSAIVNFFVSRKIYKVAREEDSIAMAADALHLKADVWTSLGVGVGLLLLWVTKLYFLDPLIAMLVAIFIIREAVKMLRRAYQPLLDETLSDQELGDIQKVLDGYKGQYIDFHELRTRRAGKFKHIDLHLTVAPTLSTLEAHALTEKIEQDLARQLHNTVVLIHVEPSAES
jgi:cation diffusion facilitator family transporter